VITTGSAPSRGVRSARAGGRAGNAPALSQKHLLALCGVCCAVDCAVLCAVCYAMLLGLTKFIGLQLYKVQQFRCYRSGPRRLLGEYGGIEADRQTTSSRQQAAADS
jgi:hypothetical protein